MKPCKCLGLENITWKCNWNCKHCFFRRFPQLHKNIDQPIAGVKSEIDAGKARGCTSVVLCCKGESMLHSQVEWIIRYISSVGMKSLIITNGSIGIEKYRRVYDAGLDHLQISMHGLGETLDKISERKDAGKKQMELLEWLHKENHPFRINVMPQLLNYHEILGIIKRGIQLGAFHVSLLTFLPHYDWKAHIKDVAVHPLKLVDEIEKSLEYVEGKALITLRYFPMCLLKPRFWKYVTNAQFVLFDPWEWEYGYYSEDTEKVWGSAVKMNEAVEIKGQPCASCLLKNHCGGWNKFYAQAFSFEGLRAIKKVPNELEEAVNIRGGLFDLNPANKQGI